MKLKFQFITVFLFTILFSFAFIKGAQAADFTLSGSVTNSSNAPIGGAIVIATDVNSGAQYGPTTTELSSGNYNINSIPSGTYNVQVVPPVSSGYQSTTVHNQVISGDTSLNFMLVPGQTLININGHITTNNGIPVSGIKVGGVTTDTNGFYSLNRAPGTISLSLINDATISNIKSNFLAQVSINASTDTTFDVQIPTSTLTVHVQDSNNNPIQGATVIVDVLGKANIIIPLTTNRGSINFTVMGGINGSGDLFTGKSESNGNFVGPVITNGQYTVKVNPPSIAYQGSTSDITVISDQTHPVTLQSLPTITISGHITTNNGVPVSGIKVGGVTTDTNGFYSILKNPGPITLSFTNDATVSTIKSNFLAQVSINASTDTTFDVQIPTSNLIVHVQDSNTNSLANATVIVDVIGKSNTVIPLTTSIGTVNFTILGGVNGSGDLFAGRSGTDGNLAGPVISGGQYTVTVNPPSNAYSSNSSNITITSDQTYPVTLQSKTLITISGHITTNNGVPISGFNVGNGVITDGNGFYSLTKAPGNISMTFVNDPTTSSIKSSFKMIFNINESTNTTLDVQIPTSNLTVQVQDVNDYPIPNVEVIVDVLGKSNITIPLTTSIGTINFMIMGGINGSGDLLNGSTGSDGILAGQVITGGQYSIYVNPHTPSYLSTTSNVSVSTDLNQIYSLQYSHNSPVTTATLSPAADNQGNYSDPTTLTLSATAASGYTVANTYYTIDGGSQQTYSSPFTVSGDGSHTITYWSVDNSGVQELHNSKTFTIVVPTPTPTPTNTPTPTPPQVTALNPAGIWVGLTNSDDIGIKFDLLADVYRDGVLVSSGQLDSVAGGSSGFNNAHLYTIPFNAFQPADFPQGSQLTLTLSVRNACSGSGKNSGRARLWYNDTQANTHFSATIGQNTTDYFLRDNFLLSTIPGQGPKKTIDIQSGAKCSPFKPFGTWNITP